MSCGLIIDGTLHSRFRHPGRRIDRSLSAALLWRNNGRIAGISGIAGGLLTPRATDVVRRAAFILGLIAAPVFYGFAGGALPKIEVTSPCW